MRRLRLGFLLLGIVLLIPTALLSRRALDAVAMERAARHRTVAERVFDEMERSLSGFLEREEARPFDGYLASLPTEPFVQGHFQVGADGRIAAAQGAQQVERVVRSHLEGRDDAKQDDDRVVEDQAPGTTLALDEGRLRQLEALGYIRQEKLEDSRLPARKRPNASAYDAIQSLNRGAQERATRGPKVVEEAYAEADAAPSEAGLLRDYARSEAPAPSPQRERRRAPAGRASALEGVLSRTGEAPAAEAEPKLEALNQGARRLAKSLRITVDPLLGRVVEDRHLLLYRTVWIGEQGIRQGLLVDVPALTGWLEEGVLRPLGLPAQVSFVPGVGEAASSPSASATLYRHRFAEPFQGVSAALALAPLADGRSAGSIYALSLLVLLAGAAGLFAIYRMVAVTVAFAERRSNFVAAVSHELRTPLTAIRMYGEMLRDGMVQSEGKRQEYYATITAESERLSRLINNVLEFSRLEKGTREMNLVAGDLGPVVNEVAEVVRPHAEREGFALRVEIGPSLPPVRFDRDALLQVLFNLVDNAVKYAGDAADRSIDIACRSAGDGVELVVRDHGPGVPPRHLSRVFEPFYRGQDELTRTTKGTGLGLALVKGLVERMGAVISGANARDGGLEVRVRFPLGVLS